MPPKQIYPATQKATIGWPADGAAELQHYRAFVETIQRFCEKERLRNTLIPKEFLNYFLAYLEQVITSEAENTAFGQATMHRRQRTILNIKRRPYGNRNFGDFIMQTLYISRAEMHPFQSHELCEFAYQVCADVAVVKVALELKPEVPAGESIRTLLKRTIVACRKLQTSSKPSRRLARLIEVLIKDLENLWGNLIGRKLNRAMIPEIELMIWSQEEQFNNLINKAGEEVTHKSRTGSDLLMPLLSGKNASGGYISGTPSTEDLNDGADQYCKGALADYVVQ